MKSTYVIDIETMPDQPREALAPFLDKVRGDGRMNVISQARDREEKIEKVIQKAALSPVCGRIICIQVLKVDEVGTDKEQVTPFFLINESEKQTLQDFANINMKEGVLVTYNGRGFDFPYLIFRAGVHGVEIDLPHNQPYNGRDNHVDMMTFLGEYSGLDRLASKTFDYIGLAKWEEYWGLEVKKSIKTGGIDLNALFLAGQYDEIKTYGMKDVEDTLYLFRKFAFHFRNLLKERYPAGSALVGKDDLDKVFPKHSSEFPSAL